MASKTDQLSLRRDEAERRAQVLRVRRTTVELDLTGTGETFKSRTTLELDCLQAGRTFLDFKGSELRSATLDDAPLDRDSWAHGRLPLSLTEGPHIIVVEGVMAYSADGEGMHRHVDPADSQTYLYAMSFLDAAPRWFACFDQPDLKSAYLLDVRAPEHWTVVGNGPSEQVGPGHWRVAPTRPLSTYDGTLVAGPYASLTDSHDGIRLGLHVRASLAEFLQAESRDIFEVTKASFDYYHRVFGIRYPFGEYHQAFVPDFNAGAMENPGCVTFREQYVFRGRATASDRASRAGTIAHEMAHMWFGDLVTMRWWDDLWLNESFAEYMAHRCCTEATRYPLWVEFGVLRKDWGSVADQSPSTHPVARNGSADAQAALQDFDGISYAKGAAVLRQLVATVGDDVFLGGLREYFRRHAFANASFADLLQAWHGAGAAGLDQWARHWLETSGMDLLEVVRSGPDVRIVRRPPQGAAARGVPVDRRHAIWVAAVGDRGAVLDRTRVTVGAEAAHLRVPHDCAVVVPDSGDDTWARVRFGPWPAALSVLPDLDATVLRVVMVNAVRDAVRSAELDPVAALAALCQAARAEQSEVVLHSMLQFADAQLAGPFAPVDQRAARADTVHSAAATVLQEATPGSDRQLAAFRLTVRTSDDADTLDSWLHGRLPGGLVLDPELRWALVERLVMLTADADLIDTSLQADPSAAAQAHAARARAALPTAAAKQAAWDLVVNPSDHSAYEVYATARGFFLPTQEAVTAPYVPAYFEQVPATARFRTGWALGQVALLAYPATATFAETLRLADTVLGDDRLAGPVRRAVVDGTDRLRRAIASQQRFGT
jgi:aminopeptidase N